MPAVKDDSQSSPRATIITPVFNGQTFIAETVKSVLLDADDRIEYIVLDDGSTDGTLDVLRPFRERITLVSHANMGEARTVNKGVAMASSDIVCIVNADDPIRPGLIQAALTRMESDSTIAAAYPDWHKIDEQNVIIATIRTHEFDYRVLVEQFLCLPGPGCFFRRCLLNGELARNPQLRYVSDYDLWLRLGLRGKFVRIPETLATWREHSAGASTSARGREMASNRIEIMQRFFARSDLPNEVRSWERQALATAYYCAGLLALHDQQVPGRRYFLKSWLLAPVWPRHFLLERQRAWSRILFVMAQPLSRWALQLLQSVGLYRQYR
jgi:glycosyltransferase involved in cell wall biosynthesis